MRLRNEMRGKMGVMLHGGFCKVVIKSPLHFHTHAHGCEEGGGALVCRVRLHIRRFLRHNEWYGMTVDATSIASCSTYPFKPRLSSTGQRYWRVRLRSSVFPSLPCLLPVETEYEDVHVHRLGAVRELSIVIYFRIPKAARCDSDALICGLQD